MTSAETQARPTHEKPGILSIITPACSTTETLPFVSSRCACTYIVVPTSPGRRLFPASPTADGPGWLMASLTEKPNEQDGAGDGEGGHHRGHGEIRGNAATLHHELKARRWRASSARRKREAPARAAHAFDGAAQYRRRRATEERARDPARGPDSWGSLLRRATRGSCRARWPEQCHSATRTASQPLRPVQASA